MSFWNLYDWGDKLYDFCIKEYIFKSTDIPLRLWNETKYFIYMKLEKV